MGRCASGVGGEGAPEACASAAGISVSPCACKQDGECEDACGPLCPDLGGPTWTSVDAGHPPASCPGHTMAPGRSVAHGTEGPGASPGSQRPGPAPAPKTRTQGEASWTHPASRPSSQRPPAGSQPPAARGALLSGPSPRPGVAGGEGLLPWGTSSPGGGRGRRGAGPEILICEAGESRAGGLRGDL